MGIAPTIEYANLGMADSLILMVLALVVFGPRRLPQIGRQIGKIMYEFRKASNDFKFQMEEELRQSEDAERRKQDEARRRQEEETRRALPPGPPTLVTDEIHPVYAEAVAAEAAEPYPPETPAAPEPPKIQPPASGVPVAATPPSRLAGLVPDGAAEPLPAEPPAQPADAPAAQPAQDGPSHG